MNYFLDTNICIYALKGAFPHILDRLKEHDPQSIRIPAIVKAELLLGGEKSNNPHRTLTLVRRFLAPFEIVPFCTRAAEDYARIRQYLEQRGKVIGPNDLIVASTVLANGGILVTRDTGEFRRIPGLSIQNWTR